MGLLTLSATSFQTQQTLHKVSIWFLVFFFLKALSWLVGPHSRKPHREVHLQKVSTRSQASLSSHQANERPGPPAVLLFVTQDLHADVRHSSHFAKVTQEKALGYTELIHRSGPLIFSAKRGENKAKTQQSRLLWTALSYNGVTPPLKTTKD